MSRRSEVVRTLSTTAAIGSQRNLGVSEPPSAWCLKDDFDLQPGGTHITGPLPILVNASGLWLSLDVQVYRRAIIWAGDVEIEGIDPGADPQVAIEGIWVTPAGSLSGRWSFDHPLEVYLNQKEHHQCLISATDELSIHFTNYSTDAFLSLNLSLMVLAVSLQTSPCCQPTQGA